MDAILILVASKEEADLLLSRELDNFDNIHIVITGFGFGATIKSIREYAHECLAINVGFVGVPEHMELYKLLSINTSILGPNEKNITKPVTLKAVDSLPQLPCVSVADFEENPSKYYPNTVYTKDYVIDMELYILANFFDNVYSIKVPSDNGSMAMYDSISDYKAALSQIRTKIYNIICEIVQEHNQNN